MASKYDHEIDKTFTLLRHIVVKWKKDLANYSVEELQAQPGPDQWSMGQLYMHMMMASDLLAMTRIHECFKEDKARKGNKNFNGKMVFLLGGIPNIKIKVPKAVAVEVPQASSAKELEGVLDFYLSKLDKLQVKMKEKFDPTAKRKHPLMGMLNALEWLKFVVFHFRHHEAQKKRINMFLKKRTAA